MALELELTGIVVVALGKVYIEAETETIIMTDGNLPQHHRRVHIIEDIEPTAPLPCREADMLYVCEALDTYVAWPSHLIFPRNKVCYRSLTPKFYLSIIMADLNLMCSSMKSNQRNK